MTYEEAIRKIRPLVKGERFQPFDVVLKDGRRYPVVGPDFVRVTHNMGLNVFKPPRREGEPSEGLAGFFDYSEVSAFEPSDARVSP